MVISKSLSKEQKQLLIALLIGDGTISNNNVFKLSHASQQIEYLQWKIQQLNNVGLVTNGIKTYTSTCGYNTGKSVIYTQLPINSTIKALRRTVYNPKKTFSRKLLNWLNPLGIAIWFMDDGFINVNTSKHRSSIQHTIKISTCVDEHTANIMILYFKEKWDITFKSFIENKKYYSLRTSSESDCSKFIELIKPYVLQVPSMLYKIRKDLTKEEFIEKQLSGSEVRDLLI
jgi:LAGLIDADG DNA endonuclease family